MANHFVDEVNGSNGNSGHTMDAAWATLSYAIVSGSLAAGDDVWVRRNVTESASASFTSGYSGTASSPIRFIGCPRNSHSITSSDWTHGSTEVTVDDANMTYSRHCGRYITGPDSRVYLITRVVDSDTIIIDREYIGATTTNAAATISADEDYTAFNAIDDSAWTIKKSDWNADAADLPHIDFGNGAYNYQAYSAHLIHKNIEFRNSSSGSGIVDADCALFVGCLFTQTTTGNRGLFGGNIYLKRCIGVGNQVTTSQYISAYSTVDAEDSAFYGVGSRGFNSTPLLRFKNVNIGVEIANGSYDIYQSTQCVGFDVRLGGTNGYVFIYARSVKSFISIENYQKIQGVNRTFVSGGYYENSLVTASTTPNKKLSDYVIKATPNLDNHVTNNPDKAFKIYEHRVWADTTSKTYRLWIYNAMSAVINDTTALDNLFMRITYISGYDDTSEYQYTSVFSTQIDIAAAADAADWDYLERSGVQPAVAGWVIIEVFQSQYSASGSVYVDPEPVIS